VRRFHALQSTDIFRVLTFRKGDTVFVAEGSCQGTVGTFLNFRDDDPNWADIFERNSQVRSHPVRWLEHMPR
jgi:ribosomal protein S4E